jgi:hypothetical protein
MTDSPRLQSRARVIPYRPGAVVFLSFFILLRICCCSIQTGSIFFLTTSTSGLVSREVDEEDLNARELLRRAYSAGPVSPTCFDV